MEVKGHFGLIWVSLLNLSIDDFLGELRNVLSGSPAAKYRALKLPSYNEILRSGADLFAGFADSGPPNREQVTQIKSQLLLSCKNLVTEKHDCIIFEN